MKEMAKWKRRLVTAAPWSLLAAAIFAVPFALLTVFKCPHWLNWVVGMVVPEWGLWFALLMAGSGVAALFFRHRHPVVTTATVSLSIVAIVLFLKPTIQAWRLGGDLPTRLRAAFGPASPQRAPFSLTAVLERNPEPVPIETMQYSGSLLLDFYRAVGRSPAPCVIVLHGGGWIEGDRKDNGTKRPLNDWLARRGYAVASIDYRLSPASIWPAPRDDVLAAMAYLRSHATALGIDPSRFVLLGRSAGGQIAAATAYSAHDPGIRGVIVFYAPTDFRMTWDASASADPNLRWGDVRPWLKMFLGGTPESAGAAYDSASATRLIDSGTPPTLLLQGRLDVNVMERQNDLLAKRLADAGVPHLLVAPPWAAHGFDLVSFNSPGGQITTYTVDWFVSAVTR